MSRKLISRSPDLCRLRDDGYHVEIQDGHLLVHDVPYLDAQGLIRYATLVSTLDLSGDITATPTTHVVHFTGTFPHQKDGKPIEGLRHQDKTQELAPGLVIRHSFSNKPDGGYPNYYDKMTRYVEVLASQAKAVDSNVTAQPSPLAIDEEECSVFRYTDTASSRAGITALAPKLMTNRLAIIGMGGTASYLLDFLAKTPAKEIHLFDGDLFLQHNAFRSPGAPSCDALNGRPMKVDYFAAIYGNLHRGIIPHPAFVTEENVEELATMDFVFICIDNGPARRVIAEALMRFKVPFIDVGMGVERSELGLCAILRVTACTEDRHAHFHRRASTAEDDEQPGVEYTTNVQIAELNAINAGLAIIKYKKMRGFYADEEGEFSSTLTTSTNLLTSDEVE